MKIVIKHGSSRRSKLTSHQGQHIDLDECQQGDIECPTFKLSLYDDYVNRHLINGGIWHAIELTPLEVEVIKTLRGGQL
jgi:hypothetical protein